MMKSSINRLKNDVSSHPFKFTTAVAQRVSSYMIRSHRMLNFCFEEFIEMRKDIIDDTILTQFLAYIGVLQHLIVVI